jgi:hypothetical protein
MIHFYTHIPLLLTYFHLYRKFSHVTGIYTGNKQKVSKRRHSGRHKIPRQGNGTNLGPNQGQPMSAPKPKTREEPIARRRGHAPPATWPHLTRGGSLNTEAGSAGVYSGNIPPKPTKPSLYKRRGAPLNTPHTP